MTLEYLVERWDYLYRFDHGRWHLWPLGGISTSWIAGVWAQVDGTHVVNLIALGVLAIGSSCLGLYRMWEVNRARAWKQHELDQIEIDEARRVSLARVPQPAIIISPGVPAMKQVDAKPEPPAPERREEPKP